MADAIPTRFPYPHQIGARPTGRGMKKGVGHRHEVEKRLRAWLHSHHHVIGTAEARRQGATKVIVTSMVDRGEWAFMHKGVYRDTATPPGPYQDLRGAHVASGGLTVVSHVSAAWDWGLLRDPPARPEVTIRRGSLDPRRFQALTVHLSRDLEPATVVERNALLVTNPLRTMVDIAGFASPRLLTEAIDSALAVGLFGIDALAAEIARLSKHGRNGVDVLRQHLLERGFVGAPTPSVLESRMWRLIRRTGLPSPTVELHVYVDGAYRLDLAWPEIRLAIEVDGYRWHSSPERMSNDATRRNRLQRAGWTVLVYTWRDLVTEPSRVAREIIETHHRLSRLA